MEKFKLRLYVTGKTSKSERAIANLKKMCKEELKGRYVLQIIDVLESPQLAEDEKIIATPTLVKDLPPPLKRLIGDLSNKEKTLIGLDLSPIFDENSEENDENEKS